MACSPAKPGATFGGASSAISGSSLYVLINRRSIQSFQRHTARRQLVAISVIDVSVPEMLGKTQAAREIERRNAPVGLSVTTSSDPYLPTDSTPFYMKRVPVLAAFTGVHEEYATPRDHTELINFEGVRDISRPRASLRFSRGNRGLAPCGYS